MSDNIVYCFLIKYRHEIEEKEAMEVSWEEKTVEESREEFVKLVLAKEKSKAALCLEYGISRPIGDKWIARYLSGESMSNRSRAPFKTPLKTDTETEKLILDMRKKHPTIGAVKLRRMLSDEGKSCLPCNSTINAVLKRNNCISKEASEAATPYTRFEKETPNDMWQADFKGHFAMNNGERCHPLTVIDDHSRFNMCIDAKLTESGKGVTESFIRLFNQYGMPKSLLCDNGNPWGTSQSTGFTRFEVWLMDLGVLTIHCRIRHPQTQGKVEHFNQTLKRELIKNTTITDVRDAQLKFDEYREFYNNKRPHFALELDTPSKHYEPSKGKFTNEIEEWEYPAEYETRKIKSTGFLTYKGQGYFLSEAIGDRIIGIRESSSVGYINLYYRQFRIGRIDVDQRSIVSRKIYLA